VTLLHRLLHTDRNAGGPGTRTMTDWATVVEQHQRMVATLASVQAVEPPSARPAS
jgi:hypothetical protein